MKNITLLFLFFTILIQKTKAQEVNFEQVQDVGKNNIIQDIIRHDKTGFYALRKTVSPLTLKKSRPVIEKYTSDMQLVYQSDLEKFNPENTQDQAFFTFNDNILVTGSTKDYDKKQIEYFLNNISEKTGKIVGQEIELSSEKFGQSSEKPHIDYEISHDESKLAFLINNIHNYTMTAFNAEKYIYDFSEMTLKVLNQDLTELWSRKITLPYNNDQLSILEFHVNNSGDIYLLIQHKDEDWREKKEKKMPYYGYKILVYSQISDNVEEYDIRLDDKHIIDILFHFDALGNIVCSGFFSPNFSADLTGAFTLKLDTKTKEIVQQNTKNFDTSSVLNFMPQLNAEDKLEINPIFKLKSFSLQNDKSLLLIGETYYSAMNSGYTAILHHFGPVVVVKINPENEIQWITQFEKNQYSPKFDFSSYSISITEDKTYFLFNKKINVKLNPFIVSINSNGKVSEKEILLNKEEKLLINTKGCEQISNQEMLIYGTQKKRVTRFGKLTF